MPRIENDPVDITQYRLPIWDRHKGQTLAKIAEDDSGLEDLHWLSERTWCYKALKKIITKFLNRTEFSKRLGQIKENKAQAKRVTPPPPE